MNRLRKKPGRSKKHATNRERVAAQRQKAKEQKLQLLTDQLRLRMQDTYEGNWDECEWSCAEMGIRLYSGFGTQPLTATFYYPNIHQFPWLVYPATSTILSSSCTYIMMSIDPLQKLIATCSVRQYSIPTDQPKRTVARRISHI